MNELSVVIANKPGTLVWTNYPDIVAELERTLEQYKGIAYTDATIKDAKTDKATLNKLKTEIEDARKQAKRIWMEPYQAIEDKAKNLTSMIDSQIAEIDASLSEYERARVEQATAEIREYMASAAKTLPDEMFELFYERTFSPRWTNKTFKKAEWKNAVDEAVSKCASDIACIRGMAENKAEADIAVEAYVQTMALSNAVSKLNELKRQREVIKANMTKEILAKDDEKTIEATFPSGFDNMPDDDELTDLMAVLADDEPKKEQRKVLCIHGKGDDMRKVQNMAESLGLNIWYQFMD